MLYRAIHTAVGEIMLATYVDDNIDTAAEAADYAAQGLFVCPITEAEYPDAVAAVNDDSWYIDYVGVEETPTMFESPPKPGEYYVFDFVAHTWSVSAEQLSRAKGDKYTAISAKYRERLGQPYTDSGATFNDRIELLPLLRAMIDVLEFTETIPAWWDGFRGDNGVYLTPAGTWSGERDACVSRVYAIELYRMNCKSVDYVHRAAVTACATVGDVLAYDVTTGWPT